MPKNPQTKAAKTIEVKQFETDYLKRLGTLGIKDLVAVEPASPMEFRTNEDRNAVAVMYNGYAAEVSARIEMFAKLDSGCKVPARP